VIAVRGLGILGLLVLLVLLGACGDNGGSGRDGAIDASDLPAAPALGTQIDRMGRPAINTALDGLLDPAAAATAKKDAYNQAADAASWPVTPNGCGNDPLYAGPASATSYAMLAGVLADDQLFVDTSKGSCGSYLAIEAAISATGPSPHTQCGGRAPSHDVIDTSYSFLAAGAGGFDPQNGFAPRITDGVQVHPDVDDSSFPFLGSPH